MSVTILKIAERLNISHSTVSRVLNNKPNTYIAEKTRLRVLHAAQEMGYRPNLAARSMRDSRSNLVAVFASPDSGIWGAFTPDIVREIAKVLHKHQLDVFFAFTPHEGEAHNAEPAWRYDAAVMLQYPNEETLRRVRASGLPCVAVNELLEGSVCIISDEASGIRQAIEHLFNQGHRQIAYANASNDYHLPHHSIGERESNYASILNEYGMKPIAGYNTQQPSSNAVPFLQQTAIENGATAIIAYDHVIAVDIYSAAHMLKIRIPEDISVIAFNDAFPSERMAPPLTVVAPQGWDMGRIAAEKLLEMINHKTTGAPEITRVTPRLIVRGSTAPLMVNG